jgi:hypothetical protein
MWPSARFRRSANVPGLSSADIQKSLKTCRTIWRRRSISCYLVALGSDRNAIGDRLFLCHGIHSFIRCVRIRTALPPTGQFLDELNYDLDPTRHRHIAPPPEARSFSSAATSLSLELVCPFPQRRPGVQVTFFDPGRPSDFPALRRAVRPHAFGWPTLFPVRYLWSLLRWEGSARAPWASPENAHIA